MPSAEIYNHPHPWFGFYSASGKDLHCGLCNPGVPQLHNTQTPVGRGHEGRHKAFPLPGLG